MVNIAMLIQFIYPTAIVGPPTDSGVDVIVSDGEISYWNESKLGAQPTKEELESRETEYLLGKLDSSKVEAKRELLEIVSRFYETVLGEPLTPELVGTWTAKKMSYDRWASNGKPTPLPAEFPIAEAERVEFDPPRSISQLLQLWGEKNDLLTGMMAIVEPIRRRAMNSIDGALTESEVRGAVEAAADVLVGNAPIG